MYLWCGIGAVGFISWSKVLSSLTSARESEVDNHEAEGDDRGDK